MTTCRYRPLENDRDRLWLATSAVSVPGWETDRPSKQGGCAALACMVIVATLGRSGKSFVRLSKTPPRPSS